MALAACSVAHVLRRQPMWIPAHLAQARAQVKCAHACLPDSGIGSWQEAAPWRQCIPHVAIARACARSRHSAVYIAGSDYHMQSLAQSRAQWLEILLDERCATAVHRAHIVHTVCAARASMHVHVV